MQKNVESIEKRARDITDIEVSHQHVTVYMWFYLAKMKGDRAAKSNRKFVEKKNAPKRSQKQIYRWVRE